MKTLEQIIEEDFWLFWGESPEGTLKRKRGEAVLVFILQAIEKSRQEEMDRVQKLIVDEILICHKEGTPTSRLTSLSNKL